MLLKNKNIKPMSFLNRGQKMQNFYKILNSNAIIFLNIEYNSHMTNAYRTKMEYSIYVDDQEVLHLAQHVQGSKRGLIITDEGSDLALPNLNQAAKHVIKLINQKGVKKFQIKGIMLRYSTFEDKSVVFIYIKDEELKLDAGDFFDPKLMKGVYIYHSTKKSPAFVQTQLMSEVGTKELIEKLGTKEFSFPADGFFQINIPVVQEFLKDSYKIVSELPESKRSYLLDLYAGVGTIGIYHGDLFKKVVGVELFPGSKEFALKNAKVNGLTNYDFYESRSEDANLTTLLSTEAILFLDPPRAGCMPKVLEAILSAKPEYVFYLSCNPETQERDIKILENNYDVIHQKEYDFFPNTDHLEKFVVLKRI